MHYDINDYPAIKDYLLSFGIERLEQTGNTSLINGQLIKSRKKTNNKWFETQDSISYWDDFSRQKIIWKRVGSLIRFCYDEKGYFCLDSTCFATGENLKFLTLLLNSPMGKYLLKNSPKTGTGDLLISVQAIEPIKVPAISKETGKMFESYFNDLLYYTNNKLYKQADELTSYVNNLIFNLYQLDFSEVEHICAFEV